ncbi:MAG: PD-(D/E)XK nuclease family protein, partial [Ilumatobacteraceae bacterium]
MYPVPTSLSPSRVEAFTSCPMAFRFASIERLPESPSPHTTKGSLVHRVLELLFTHATALRTIETARACFDRAVDEYAVDPEFTLL